MGEPTFTNKQPLPGAAVSPALKWVCYYRVSTQRQGNSGLGLEAQVEAVNQFIEAKGAILAQFTEIESGKRSSNRPELQKALELCKKEKATLVIAKLDRLARNVHFISGLLEANISFVAADQPTRDRFWLHMMAAFAEEEGRRISQRTKEALAAAKRRGVDIGATGKALAIRHRAEALQKAKAYSPILQIIRAEGFKTVRSIRDELNSRKVVSPGGGRWHLLNTHKLLSRL